MFLGTPPLPDTEEGCEDGSVNLGEVVVAVVDRLQLVQLWESVPGESESESLVPAWLTNLGISSRWLKEASRNLIPFWFFIGI